MKRDPMKLSDLLSALRTLPDDAVVTFLQIDIRLKGSGEQGARMNLGDMRDEKTLALIGKLAETERE